MPRASPVPMRRAIAAATLALQAALPSPPVSAQLFNEASSSSVAQNGAVDCNEYQSELTISQDPPLSMAFVVNTPPGSGGGTNAVLSQEEMDAGGIFSAELRYRSSEAGWVAFALSTDGRMVGSESIICLPSRDVGPSNPGKYDLTSLAASGVQLLGEDRQTLRYADCDFDEDEGVTTLTFTKLLNEMGEIPINPNGQNTFLWAVGVGSGDDLGYHGFNRGRIELGLEECTTEGLSSATSVVLSSGSESYRSAWKAHGTMGALAWGLFAPVAVAAALLRSLFPKGERFKGLWFRIHRALNALCWIFTVVVFSLAVSAARMSGGTNFATTHGRVGLSLFVLLFVQCVGGVARPDLPKAKPETALSSSSSSSSTDHHDEEEERYDGPPPKKSKYRVWWEVVHRLSGAALLGMGFYNVSTGLSLYAGRFGVDTYEVVFRGWIVAFVGVVTLWTVYAKFFRDKLGWK